jgi:lysozyme
MTDVCFVADLGSQNPVDFNRLKAAAYNGVPCVGVILRATRSNCMVDSAFAARATAAGQAGLEVGAYAFCTGESAERQATRFINAAVSRDFSGALLRALDFEPNPSGSQMSFDTALEFLDRVDQKFGRATWLYSGSRIKALITQATDAQREFLEKHPLWGCEYGPRWRNIDVNGHALPWEHGCTLWQFTDGRVGPLPHTFDGLEPHADISLFQGTREQLVAQWSGAALKATPPTSMMGVIEQDVLSLLRAA